MCIKYTFKFFLIFFFFFRSHHETMCLNSCLNIFEFVECNYLKRINDDCHSSSSTSSFYKQFKSVLKSKVEFCFNHAKRLKTRRLTYVFANRLTPRFVTYITPCDRTTVVTTDDLFLRFYAREIRNSSYGLSARARILHIVHIAHCTRIIYTVNACFFGPDIRGVPRIKIKDSPEYK